jgi:hypothetical protein
METKEMLDLRQLRADFLRVYEEELRFLVRVKNGRDKRAELLLGVFFAGVAKRIAPGLSADKAWELVMANDKYRNLLNSYEIIDAPDAELLVRTQDR